MKKKILFIVNHAAFFVSHRLILAEAIIKKGWHFNLIIGKSASSEMERKAVSLLKKKKIKFTRTTFSSGFSFNIFDEFFSIIKIIILILKYKPDIVHLVSPKAILIGGIASKLLNIKNVVIAITGMGSLITFNQSSLTNLSKKIYFFILKNFIFSKTYKIIVQNTDDKKEIKKVLKLNSNKNFELIPGSGVNQKKLKFRNKIKIKKNVLMSSRILIDKGVIEYFKAAKNLKKKYKDWNFILIGAADYKSHAALNKDQFFKLLNEKNVVWLGYKSNIEKYLKNASIICLPSYREGMSKFLIEGVMYEKPIITTNVSGCRDLVNNNKTGFLVKPKNSNSLTKGLEKLISNENLIIKFIKNYSNFNKTKFSTKNIIKKTLNLYDKF